MTKRPYDSITASPNVQLPGRQASHDTEADGSHEEANGSTLKKPRSFMATLVRTLFILVVVRVWLTVAGLRYMPIEEDKMR